jgi:hypothetical protein
VLSFSLQLEYKTFYILKILQQDINNVYWSSSKVHVFLVRFQSNMNYLDRFFKKLQMEGGKKILSSRSRVVPCGHRQTYGLMGYT